MWKGRPFRSAPCFVGMGGILKHAPLRGPRGTPTVVPGLSSDAALEEEHLFDSRRRGLRVGAVGADRAEADLMQQGQAGVSPSSPDIPVYFESYSFLDSSSILNQV